MQITDYPAHLQNNHLTGNKGRSNEPVGNNEYEHG
jgi:hypothetical protein